MLALASGREDKSSPAIGSCGDHAVDDDKIEARRRHHGCWEEEVGWREAFLSGGGASFKLPPPHFSLELPVFLHFANPRPAA